MFKFAIKIHNTTIGKDILRLKPFAQAKSDALTDQYILLKYQIHSHLQSFLLIGELPSQFETIAELGNVFVVLHHVAVHDRRHLWTKKGRQPALKPTHFPTAVALSLKHGFAGPQRMEQVGINKTLDAQNSLIDS